MRHFKNIFFMFCSLITCLHVIGQTRTITGKVTGPDNAAVSGATIAVKGTAVSTSANDEGEFSLNVSQGDITLVISSVGFATKEQVVRAGSGVVTVSLVSDDAELGEVVVVGYGVQRKSDLTGAVSSIKGEDLTQLATQRVDQALQGRAAGVLV